MLQKDLQNKKKRIENILNVLECSESSKHIKKPIFVSYTLNNLSNRFLTSFMKKWHQVLTSQNYFNVTNFIFLEVKGIKLDSNINYSSLANVVEINFIREQIPGEYDYISLFYENLKNTSAVAFPLSCNANDSCSTTIRLDFGSSYVFYLKACSINTEICSEDSNKVAFKTGSHKN